LPPLAVRLSRLRLELLDGDADILPGLSVIATPGHTAGSICLLDDANGTIFSGDAIYVDARLGWEDPEAFATSLIRLRDLDVRVVHSGHGRSFDVAELRAVVDATLAELG